MKSKRVQLRQLAFACEPQGDCEEAVDQDRPNELLGHRHIEMEDVVPHASTLTTARPSKAMTPDMQ
jgi:hypothetical protein